MFRLFPILPLLSLSSSTRSSSSWKSSLPSLAPALTSTSSSSFSIKVSGSQDDGKVRGMSVRFPPCSTKRVKQAQTLINLLWPVHDQAGVILTLAPSFVLRWKNWVVLALHNAPERVPLSAIHPSSCPAGWQSWGHYFDRCLLLNAYWSLKPLLYLVFSSKKAFGSNKLWLLSTWIMVAFLPQTQPCSNSAYVTCIIGQPNDCRSPCMSMTAGNKRVSRAHQANSLSLSLSRACHKWEDKSLPRPFRSWKDLDYRCLSCLLSHSMD